MTVLLQGSHKQPACGQVLVVDETSMVSAEMWEEAEKAASSIRPPTSKPFGGIQTVLCGDFFQCACPAPLHCRCLCLMTALRCSQCP